MISSADNAAETCIQVRYDVLEVPVTLPSQKPHPDKPNPKQGIGEAESSAYVNYFILFVMISTKAQVIASFVPVEV